MLVGYAVSTFGKDAPVPLLAAQIRQESGWNPKAQSPYACGLAQFTPDTQTWVNKKFNLKEGSNTCFSPAWSLKAQMAYNKWLGEQVKGKNVCSRWFLILRSYNGGLGWVYRDQAKARAMGLDATDAFAIQGINSGRSLPNFKENIEYPNKIAFKWQEQYKDWGGTLTCLEFKPTNEVKK